MHRHNTSLRRANKNRVLSTSYVPDIVFENPEAYDAVDFRVSVKLHQSHYLADSSIQIRPPVEVIDEAEAIWAPRNHPVFQLVPPAVGEHLELLYCILERPDITRDTFWDIYTALLNLWKSGEEDQDWDPDIAAELEAQANAPDAGEDNGVPVMDIISGLQPVQFGVNGVPSLVTEEVGNGQEVPDGVDIGETYSFPTVAWLMLAKQWRAMVARMRALCRWIMRLNLAITRTKMSGTRAMPNLDTFASNKGIEIVSNMALAETNTKVATWRDFTILCRCCF